MQSNLTPPPAPQLAPVQRRPLVLFSCYCKLRELTQLAQQLQEMKDAELALTLSPVAA